MTEAPTPSISEVIAGLAVSELTERGYCTVCVMIGELRLATHRVTVGHPCTRCQEQFGMDPASVSDAISCQEHIDLALGGNQICPHGVALVFGAPMEIARE